MSIQFNFGAGAQNEDTVSRTIKPWAYGEAFRVVNSQVGSAKMVNIKTDIDKTTAIRVTVESIENVYRTLTSDNVPVEKQVVNAKGTTIRAELKTIATKSVGEETFYLPMECDIRIRIPNDPDIDAANIDTLIDAAYAAMLDEAGNNKVTTELARGALVPKGI